MPNNDLAALSAHDDITDAMIEAGEELIAEKLAHGCRVYAADVYEAMTKARAGNLVQNDEGMRERVARALYEEDDVWHKAWPWPDLQEAQGTSDAYRRLADAAIAAMGGAR